MNFDVTDVNMVELVKKVYELSRPQGLGMLHFDSNPLTDKEAQSLIQSDGTVDLDYIRGRACKFNVYNEDGKLFVRSPWYDHTDQQFIDLLLHVDISCELDEHEHGTSCNCDHCRLKRGNLPLNQITQI